MWEVYIHAKSFGRRNLSILDFWYPQALVPLYPSQTLRDNYSVYKREF